MIILLTKRGMIGPWFLPHGREKTECQLFSLDRDHVAHLRDEALFEFIEVLLHAFSFQMCVGVSVQRETKTATTVIAELKEILKN